MKIIRKKEIETLIKYVNDERIKKILSEIKDNYQEISTEDFFKKIKEIEDIESVDYKLFLLMEEFYLRFKDIEGKK